jgi:hypothetical protein
LVLVGCYAATPPQDVPCDPRAPACPRGQQCMLGPLGHVCTTGLGEEPDASLADAPVDVPNPNAITKTYDAVIAECLDPMFPSAMACRSVNGNTQMVIDTKDTMTVGAWNAYIRFDLDNTLAGKTITNVTLRVMATTDGKAPGPDTGSVFRTGSFTQFSLEGMAPSITGNAIAGSQGAVVANTPVSWQLPATLMTGAASGSVYLAIVPNSDDGVNYYNTDGATPPRLIIEAQ